jgi:iron complex outermembrane receptor protein
MFKKSQICTAALTALGSALLVTSVPAFAQSQTVEITGSRIKRADVEGSLPVTVIKREELEASGAITVAEFMRSVTFASAGNLRPQSGSSAQQVSDISLRGLGSDRTLVLLDGRRLPKSPFLATSADLNTVPMAAVERIEILTDGASAIYGSDAVAGVVNIITRKDFDGVAVMAGYTNPDVDGGNRNEASAILGVNGEKGRIIAGVGMTDRGIVWTRDLPWGQTRGVSSYGNNYRGPAGFTALGNLRGNPATGCTDFGDPNFYLTTAGTCSYNFNAIAADEAQVETLAIFARGEYRITADWNAYLWASNSNTQSFGRYAPTPAQLTVQPGPNNPTAAAITVRHRTAAAGNRDTTTNNDLRDFMLGANGKVMNVDVDAGVRQSTSAAQEFGSNYIVRPILEQYVNSGQYDLFNPLGNPADVLSAIKATINRQAEYKVQEVFGSATFNNLFSVAGVSPSLVVGAEFRKENYKDIYDSLQEAGVIEGSAGNSASGKRDVKSAYAELLFPISKALDFSLAGRYENYSDYGSDFAPKASVRWQPMRNLTLRGSAGTGFRAPDLNTLHKKESFSAESVFDPVTCRAFGGQGSVLAPQTPGLAPADDCDVAKLVQVDSYSGANPQLDSEKSKQWSLGAVWDPLEWLSVKADYWNIKIDDVINEIGAQDVIDRTNGTSALPIPPGLYVTRDAQGAITRVQYGTANEGTLKTDGIDLSLQARWKTAGFGNFQHEWRLSYLLNYDQAGVELAGTQGLPEVRSTFGTNWSMGAFSATWNINYIGDNGTGDVATKAYWTNDLQFGWATPLKGSKLTFGILNVTNEKPEQIPYDGRQFNFYLYDYYGRQPYIRYEQKL